MSKQSKGIAIAVVAFAAAIGLVIWGGRIVLLAGGAHEIRYPAVVDTVPDPTIFPAQEGKVTPGLDLAALMAATPAALAQGKQLFAVNCVMCHGAAGKGDGAAAVALTPKPRDFTKAAGWTVGYTMANLYQTLTEGVKGTPMPAFDALSPTDRFAVAHYVESLGAFDHHDDVAAEVKQLDARYHLGEGPRGPNKVAVPVVMAHMAAEFRAPPPVASPPAADVSAGATLARRLVRDSARAARVLSQIPG
ncbi:MAG: cytochrome c, partial [Gemmatimonadota bacterium]|nr:cytochrome c [Gemmatimonadota bacterium]